MIPYRFQLTTKVKRLKLKDSIKRKRVWNVYVQVVITFHVEIAKLLKEEKKTKTIATVEYTHSAATDILYKENASPLIRWSSGELFQNLCYLLLYIFEDIFLSSGNNLSGEVGNIRSASLSLTIR